MRFKKLSIGAALVLALSACAAPSTYDGYIHAECAATTTDANGYKVTNCSSTEMPVPTVTQTVTASPTATATSPTETPVTTKVNDSTFTYAGATWQTTTANTALYNSDNHFTNVTNASWSYTFTGTKVEWYGEKAPALGVVEVSIDGTVVRTIDPYATSRSDQNLLFTSADLTQGSHTIKVRVTGTKNTASTGTYASADRLDVTSLSNATATPSPTASTPTASGVPAYDHIVVAIFENQGYSDIIGNSTAPYLNSLTQTGSNLTNAYAMARPSQPNYLHQFSGSAWGVNTNDVPYNPPRNWTTENLAHQLIAKGKTFKGYAEGLPYAGYIGPATNGYEPKHAPWVNWSNYNQTEVSRPLSDFPTDYNQLPNVSFVVGNRCNSMHDCSIGTGDTWLKNTLGAYKDWAATHNSLLIVTFDEGNLNDSTNHIYTTLNGAKVKPGNFDQNTTIHGTLGLLQDSNGLARTEGSVGKPTLAGAFQ